MMEPFVEAASDHIFITQSEIRVEIEAMPQSAAGPDGLTTLLVSHTPAQLARLLTPAFNLALDDMPSALRQAETLLLPKQSGKPSADPLAYRPITLQPVLVRLFHRVLDRRLRRLLEERGGLVSPCQAGFIPGRGTHEQATILHTLRSLGGGEMYAAFLDIQKAFDSIDHWHLLEVLRSRIGLPPEWCEVIRRQLCDNHTMILGEKVAIERGTFQGSPLSPLLCVLFLEDLAAEIKAHVEARPGDFMPLLPSSRIQRHAYLTVMLLYADDITLLAKSPVALQGLLDVVARWGERRKVIFSPKSRVSLLRGRPVHDREFSDFWMGSGAEGVPLGFQIERATGVLRYLGVPLRSYKPYAQTMRDGAERPYELDLPAFRRLVGALASVFTVPGGPSYVSVPAWVTGINQVVLGKALYPSCVVDLDYEALDSIIHKATARLLGLPPSIPAALLRWELRLMPSRLLGERNALLFARRFATRSWFFQLIIAQLARSRLPADMSLYDRLVAAGPLGRFTRLLETHWSALFPGEAVPRDRRRLWQVVADRNPADWELRVERLTTARFRDWRDEKMATYPAFYRDYLIRWRAAEDGKLPFYLQAGGNLARVALRFKAPVLRLHTRAHPQPRCVWCALGEECGAHLLCCTQLPAQLHQRLQQARACVRQEARLPAGVGVELVHECIVRMNWEGMSRDGLRLVLGAMAEVLAAYRMATPIDAQTGYRPIWPVPLHDISDF
jgi:hypothetical protein